MNQKKQQQDQDAQKDQEQQKDQDQPVYHDIGQGEMDQTQGSASEEDQSSEKQGTT